MNKTVFCAALLFLLSACDPPRNLYHSGTVEINAGVVDPKTIVRAGDSVAFDFAFPDSILLNGKLTSVHASSSDGASIGLVARKIIPSLPGGFSTNATVSTCKIWTNPGYITNSITFNLANVNGKLRGRFYMIPQEKGVYFFEQAQDGYAQLNSQSLSVRFKINFGNIDRNHQLLVDSAGAQNRFGLYLQDKINRGLEIYGFEVK